MTVPKGARSGVERSIFDQVVFLLLFNFLLPYFILDVGNQMGIFFDAIIVLETWWWCYLIVLVLQLIIGVFLSILPIIKRCDDFFIVLSVV